MKYAVVPADPDTDRADWLAKRRRYIGASDVAAILGESPWSTPFRVWAERQPDATDRPNEAMQWGTKQESLVLDQWEAEVAPLARRASLVASSEWPWLAATPDGITAAGEPVEAKVTKDWSWRDGIPRHYWWQVQTQLAVMGADMGHVAALHQGIAFAPYEVPRDADAITRLVEASRDFHERYIVGDDIPDPTSLDNRYLGDLWPQSYGEVVEVPDELAKELAAARAEHEAATARRDAAEAAVKAEMRTAAEAVTPAGVVVATWKSHDTSRIDVKRLRVERPDLAAEFTKPGESRTFLFKMKEST